MDYRAFNQIRLVTPIYSAHAQYTAPGLNLSGWAYFIGAPADDAAVLNEPVLSMSHNTISLSYYSVLASQDVVTGALWQNVYGMECNMEPTGPDDGSSLSLFLPRLPSRLRICHKITQLGQKCATRQYSSFRIGNSWNIDGLH